MRPTERARWTLALSTAATLLLCVVPYGRLIAYPLLLLSTLAHEMGHGVTALVVGGRFHRFQMWSDGSGVAEWSGDVGSLGRAAVAAGGLVGPALAAALALALARSERGARGALYGLALCLLVAELAVVRNAFAALFVGVLLGIVWLVAQRASGATARLVLVFLAVQLALAVFSRAHYLFTPVAATARGTLPSDTAVMAAALGLPYWVWGAVCGGLSLAVVAAGLRSYWR